MDIFSPTIIDNAIITGSNNASLLQVSSPSATSAFFISGSGRVGIGTTSPLSTLTVAGGDINIGTGRGIGGNFVGTYTSFITYHNDGLGFLQSASFGFRGSAYMDSISYPDAFGFGTNDLRFFTSTNGIVAPSEIMRMVGSTGFVGIGETSPSAKLEIRGSGATSATTALKVENSNASASLVVTNDIRVGINKTTPNSELDVNGNTIITGSITSTSNITTLGSVVTPSQTISVGNGWGNSSGTTNLLNIAGNLVPTATAIINSLAITSTVSQSVNPTTIIRGILVSPTFNTLGPQYRAFEWNNNQGFGLYGVGAAPNYLSGSLGIGTTSPSASLHISGASNSNLLRVGSPTSDNILFVTGSGRVGVGTTTPRELLHVGGGNLSLDSTRYIDFGNGNSRINDLGLVSGQGYSLRITTFGPIGTGTANSLTEKLRLTGSGSLGLGTDSPSARFHISGGFTDGNLMRVQSPTGAEYFFISASGNIGIGTTTPTQRLDVRGNTTLAETAPINPIGGTLEVYNNGSNAQITIHEDSGSAEARLAFRTGGNDTIFRNTSNRFLIDAESKADAIVINSDGRVGIGVGNNTPSSVMQIRGEGATSATTAFRVENSAATARLTILDDGTSAFNTSHLYVSSSGLVGVGTALPTAKLHISGASVDSLLRVGSPTNSDILFVNGNGRVGINTTSSAGFLGGNISTVTIFQNSGSGDGLTPSVGLQIVNSGSSTSAQAQLSIVTVGDKFAAFNIGTSGSGTQNNYWHLSKRNTAASHSLNLYNNNQGSFSGPLFSFISAGTSTLGENFQIQIDDANGRVGLQTTPSDFIHLYSEPGTNYLRIDATSVQAPPLAAASVAKNGYGIVGNENYLAEPDYWMEIKLDANIVLIPCYIPA